MLFTSTAVPLTTTLGAIVTDGSTLDDFVATQILPPLPVGWQAAAIPKILRVNRQIMDIKHTPGTSYKQIRTQIGTATYSCEEAGVEEPITKQDCQVLGEDATFIAVGQSLVKTVLRAREAAVAKTIFSSSGETTFAANIQAATAAWTDATNAKPLTDVANSFIKVQKATGVKPDTMLLSAEAFRNLCLTDQVLKAVKSVGAFGGGPQAMALANLFLYPGLVAQVLGLSEIIVASATYNAATDNASESNAFIWSNAYGLLFKKAQNPSQLNELALGRTFIWDKGAEIGSLATGMADALRGFVLEGYRDEAQAADKLRAREFVDMKILNASAGGLITGLA